MGRGRGEGREELDEEIISWRGWARQIGMVGGIRVIIDGEGRECRRKWKAWEIMKKGIWYVDSQQAKGWENTDIVLMRKCRMCGYEREEERGDWGLEKC